MTQITLPKTSQVGTNEWADVEDNDVAIRDVVNGNLDNGNLSASAAIAHSKLANSTAGNLLIANASGVITGTAVTGDVTISSSGVTAIGSGVIVNADVNASAAIAYSKLALSNSIVAGDIVANAVGASEIGSLPACRVRKTLGQSIPDSIETTVSFGSGEGAEDFDSDSMHDMSVNPSRLTATTAGVYQISAGAVWTADATGRREITLRANGGAQIAQAQLTSPPAGAVALQSVTSAYKLSAGEYVELRVFQSRGSALTLNNVESTFLSAVWIGEG